MGIFKTILVWPVVVLFGCHGGADSKNRDQPLGGIDVSLEPVSGGGAGLPKALRLVVRNPSSHRSLFVVPGPFCPKVTEGDRKIRFPLLGVVFRDAEGREGDTNFGPLHTDLDAESPPAPEEISLAPGGVWTRDYSTASFHFFGPCGPAANIEQLFQSGDVALDLALELIEFHPDRGLASDAEDEAPVVPQVHRRTNAITVRVKEAPGIFHRYTDEYQARELEWLDEAGDLAKAEVREDHVPDLLKEFDSPDFGNHVSAACLLQDLGPQAKRAIPKLVEVLRTSKMYGDRVLAARVCSVRLAHWRRRPSPP